MLGVLEWSASGMEPGLPLSVHTVCFVLLVHCSYSWAWIPLRLSLLLLVVILDPLNLILVPLMSMLATLTTSILVKSSAWMTLILVLILLNPLLALLG